MRPEQLPHLETSQARLMKALRCSVQALRQPTCEVPAADLWFEWV